MKAARLFFVTVLYIIVAAIYVPVAILHIASWPVRMAAWILVGRNAQGGLAGLCVGLANVLRRLARTQTAYAYGYTNLAAYDAHVKAEADRLKADFEAGLAAGRAARERATAGESAHDYPPGYPVPGTP